MLYYRPTSWRPSAFAEPIRFIELTDFFERHEHWRNGRCLGNEVLNVPRSEALRPGAEMVLRSHE